MVAKRRLRFGYLLVLALGLASCAGPRMSMEDPMVDLQIRYALLR